LRWSWGSKIAEQLLRDGLQGVGDLFQGDVLDLGCGMKPYEPLLGARVRRWIGLDRRSTASGRPRSDVFGVVAAVPFRADSFDVVLCTQVLEHLPVPAVLFQQAHEVLRPGGFLILTTPQTNPLHEEPEDFFRFTPYSLSLLATQAGFEITRLEQLGGALATVIQMLIWHLNWLRSIPLVGPPLWRGVTASLAWLALRLDRPTLRYWRGAAKDTLNWLLVARKVK